MSEDPVAEIEKMIVEVESVDVLQLMTEKRWDGEQLKETIQKTLTTIEKEFSAIEKAEKVAIEKAKELENAIKHLRDSIENENLLIDGHRRVLEECNHPTKINEENAK